MPIQNSRGLLSAAIVIAARPDATRRWAPPERAVADARGRPTRPPRATAGCRLLCSRSLPGSPSTTSLHSGSHTCCASEMCGSSPCLLGVESEWAVCRCLHFLRRPRRDDPRHPALERMLLRRPAAVLRFITPSPQHKTNGRPELSVRLPTEICAEFHASHVIAVRVELTLIVMY